MTLSDTGLIALSFGMIIFPTFVIIPAAFAFFKRIPDLWFTTVYTSSFGIASLSLLVATVYSTTALFSEHSAINLSLGILLILLTIAALYFIHRLQQWLWELGILEVISEAEAKES